MDMYYLQQWDAAKGDEDVKLIFCNPDLLWGYRLPNVRESDREDFRLAFQGVYKVNLSSFMNMSIFRFS